ncbi:uncharacterized protein LOC126677148 [Mercurialis annua]|uniref:uncharacterized protein LOC126677148 n=1 Tax=Mercurialis annua TaxID=3986 RepID=UPI00215E4221|nr:uncharacterized protein LOC126677148 [Mercurialis annua]
MATGRPKDYRASMELTDCTQILTENEVDTQGQEEIHFDDGMLYMADNEQVSDEDDENDILNESDEEYLAARLNNRTFRRSVMDTIEGLGLDDMLEAPGGVFNEDKECGEGCVSAEISREEIWSDYAETDDGLETPSSSDEDDLQIRVKKKRRRIYYNPKCNHEDLDFQVHMRFTTKDQLQNAVQQWSILNGHNVRWARSASDRIEGVCSDGCIWRLYASRINSEKTFRIRKLESKHTCHRALINRQATSEWVAKEFIQRFRRNPSYAPNDMILDIKQKYNGLTVSKSTCYRARDIAMYIIQGSLESHYEKFRAYDAELKRVDKEGLFRFFFIHDPNNGAPIFQRYYVGFSGLKKGFLAGCRPILCVDGCFLKTIVAGALLSAVGRDGNNQMFPVAWAIVEAENEETWTWFLELLMDDLRYDDGYGLTLVSDQQKGLKNAICKRVPFAEHRNCARHIYANWKKNNKGPELKRIFWNVVNATNEPEYKKHLEILKKKSVIAYDDFIKQSPKVFCKSFVRTTPLCDAITSNLVETFNGYICKARQLQAIHMLEEIRTTLMERMYAKHELMVKHHEDLCPRIRQKIDKNQKFTKFCTAKPAKGAFQVMCGEYQFVVNLTHKTCACGAWQLTGIPCSHALACINYMRHNVVDYVDDCNKREQYFKAYEFSIQPINGSNMWPEVSGYPIIPPPHRKMPGRPKKKRKRDADEEPKGRQGMTMTCKHCLCEGHNVRGCPNIDKSPTPRPPKGRPGRPKREGRPGQASTSSAKNNGKASTSSTSGVKARGKGAYASAYQQGISTSQSNEAIIANAVLKAQIQRDKRQVRKGVGLRIMTESGSIYSRPADKGKTNFVYGSSATIAALTANKRGRGRPRGSVNLSKGSQGSTNNTTLRQDEN